MRVRLLKDATAYWNYAIQAFHPDQEIDGDLARHLADNTPEGTVEILEDDREQVREAEALPAPAEPVAEPGPVGGDEPPAEGTIDDLMRWVDGDPDRAAQALAAEQAKDKPRSTVVRRLAALADTE
jgi:hypothetical protein